MGKLKSKDLGLKKPFTEEMAKAIIAACAGALRAHNPEWAWPEEIEMAERCIPAMWGEIRHINDFRVIIRGALFKSMDADEVFNRAFDGAIASVNRTGSCGGVKQEAACQNEGDRMEQPQEELTDNERYRIRALAERRARRDMKRSGEDEVAEVMEARCIGGARELAAGHKQSLFNNYLRRIMNDIKGMRPEEREEYLKKEGV